MKRLLLLANVLMKGALAVGIFLIMIIICVQVFFRFGLNDALRWPEEAARFLMIWTTFLAGAYALNSGQHTAVRIVVDQLPDRVRIPTEMLAWTGILVFLGLLAYGGITQSIGLASLSTGALGISRAIPYAVIPVSAIIYVAVSVCIMLRILRSGASNG